MNLITFLLCASVLVLCFWGRSNPEARPALTALAIAGALFLFFSGFMLSALWTFSFLGYTLMIVGAFTLAIGLPAMHFGAKTD